MDFVKRAFDDKKIKWIRWESVVLIKSGRENNLHMDSILQFDVYGGKLVCNPDLPGRPVIVSLVQRKFCDVTDPTGFWHELTRLIAGLTHCGCRDALVGVCFDPRERLAIFHDTTFPSLEKLMGQEEAPVVQEAKLPTISEKSLAQEANPSTTPKTMMQKVDELTNAVAALQTLASTQAILLQDLNKKLDELGHKLV